MSISRQFRRLPWGEIGGVLVSRRLRRCRDANQAARGGAATKAGRVALCIVNNAAE